MGLIHCSPPIKEHQHRHRRIFRSNSTGGGGGSRRVSLATLRNSRPRKGNATLSGRSASTTLPPRCVAWYPPDPRPPRVPVQGSRSAVRCPSLGTGSRPGPRPWSVRPSQLTSRMRLGAAYFCL